MLANLKEDTNCMVMLVKLCFIILVFAFVDYMLICFGQIIGSVEMGFTFLVVYFDQQSCCFELKIEVKAKSRFEQKKFSKSFVFLESYFLQILQ